MSTHSFSHTLVPILKEIARQLAALKQVLEQEYAALAEQRIADIEQAAQDKTRLSAVLDGLEQDRRTCLREAGLDFASTGLMAYLERHTTGQQPPIARIWQHIQQLSRACEAQNQINGIIIEKNRRRIQTALTILQGQSTAPQLYSATGNTISGDSSRGLATKA